MSKSSAFKEKPVYRYRAFKRALIATVMRKYSVFEGPPTAPVMCRYSLEPFFLNTHLFSLLSVVAMFAKLYDELFATSVYFSNNSCQCKVGAALSHQASKLFKTSLRLDEFVCMPCS